jgi:sterol 3beta-glucosyltransferase
MSAALKQIRDAVCAYCERPGTDVPQHVLDTTLSRLSHPSVERTHSLPAPESSLKSATVSRFSSFFKPFQETIFLGRAAAPARGPDGEEFIHVWKRGNLAITGSSKAHCESTPASDSRYSLEGSAKTPTPPKHDHTYPPSTSPTENSRGTNIHHYSWSAGVPAWLKGQSRRVLGNSLGGHETLEHTTPPPPNSTGIFEVYSSNNSRLSSRPGGTGYLEFSVLEAPDNLVDLEMKDKFRAAFAFDENETLLGCATFP